MSKSELEKLDLLDPVLIPSSAKLVSYSGHKLFPCGKKDLVCCHKGQDHKVQFQIVDQPAPALLGRAACVDLGLVQRVMPVSAGESTGDNILEEFKDLFTGLGHLPRVHHIEVDPNVSPVVHAPRKVPVALRPKVEAELQRMEQAGVIVKQLEPTVWVNSMLTIVKPNKVRICIDPKDLNSAIRREHYRGVQNKN